MLHVMKVLNIAREFYKNKNGMKLLSIVCLTIIAAVVFQYFAVANIFIGVYQWHFSQPETIQGGIETIVVLILLVLTVMTIRKPIVIISSILILIFLYLRLDYVFIPAFFALLYFETIISSGRRILSIFSKNTSDHLIEYIKYFLIGVTFWILVILSMSLLGYGNPQEIRLMAVLIFVLGLTNRGYKPLSLRLVLVFLELNKTGKAISLFLLTLLLVQFAKTTHAFDYDSIWYGLRPEQVLIGSNSFFDSLGLVQFVHYYPKLVELFKLPLSHLGDYSFIMSINVVVFGLIIIIIGMIARLLHSSRNEALLTAALIGSIPALANMASTAKSDLLTTFLLLAGFYYLCAFLLKSISNQNLIMGVTALILSLGGKLTSFLYVPLIISGGMLLLFIRYRLNFNKYREGINNYISNRGKKISSIYTVTLISSILVLVGICYRTYKLTGFPIYPVGAQFFKAIGIQPNYPLEFKIGTGNVSYDLSIHDIITRWIKLLFNPNGYEHIIMLWTGNIGFFLFLVFIVVLLKRRKWINYNFLILVIPTALSGLFFATYFNNGGDGNYFQLPIIMALICFIHPIYRFSKQYKIVFAIAMSLFIMTQSTLMFVSHPSWSWGTSKFKFNPGKSFLDSRIENEEIFVANDLANMNEYLKLNGNNVRCIGFGDESILHRLPCSFESITFLSHEHLGNPALTSDRIKFVEYLEWSKAKFIIYPNNYKIEFEEVEGVLEQLRTDEKVEKIMSDTYTLLDLSTFVDYNDLVNEYIYGWYPKEGASRWVNKEAYGKFPSGSEGVLILSGLIPNELNAQEVKIYVDNKLISSEVYSGEFTIIKDNLPVNRIVELKITVSQSFVPKELGINEDTRELSFLLTDFQLK